MAASVDFKALPPQEAIAFFRQKGYRATFSYLDMMHRAHSDAFTVAGVTRLDVLQDIRSLVDDAVANGSTLADFKKGMQQKLSAKGWWKPVEVTDDVTGETKTVDLRSSRRLRTIFNVNLRTSMPPASGRASSARRRRCRFFATRRWATRACGQCIAPGTTSCCRSIIPGGRRTSRPATGNAAVRSCR